MSRENQTREQLIAEIEITDQLLAECDRALEALECPHHGKQRVARDLVASKATPS